MGAEEKWAASKEALDTARQDTELQVVEPEVVAATPENIKDFEAFKAQREAEKATQVKNARQVLRDMGQISAGATMDVADDLKARETGKPVKPHVWMQNAASSPIVEQDGGSRGLTRTERRNRGLQGALNKLLGRGQ